MATEIPIPSFEEIYKEFSPLLRGYFYKATKNVYDTEELMQDAFERISNNLHNYDRRASIRTWTHYIARNLIIDYIRKKDTRKMTSLTGSEETFGFNNSNPEAEAIGRETERRLHDFLDNYAHQEGIEAWVLDLEELSDKEISTIQNVPVDTVKIRLHRIKKRAKEHLNINHGFYHR